MSVRYLFAFLLTLFFGSVLAFGQNSKQELNDQLFEAVRRGDAPAVTALLDKGADVNAKFRYGTTALFKAAERGHVEVVKILLARGADVSVKDTFYGATAMTWALDNNHFDIVKELLEKEPAGVEDVLMTGVAESKPEVVKIALAKGGLKKETLTTALYIASRDKDGAPTLELLKTAGAVPPPTINPTTLQSYAGKYKGEALEVTINFADGALSGFITGQRPRGLMPIDETTFKALFVDDVVVRFKIDQGKVVSLTLTEKQKATDFTRVP
jgi:hypothetical protein